MLRVWIEGERRRALSGSTACASVETRVPMMHIRARNGAHQARALLLLQRDGGGCNSGSILTVAPTGLGQVDVVTVTVEMPADRLEAFRRGLRRTGARVVSVTGAAAGNTAPTLASARRAMVAESTEFQARTLDGLYDRPGHEATLSELAQALDVDQNRVLGALGSLGAKLNQHLTGQRSRAMHLWLEETTTVSGEKLYRLRPEFIAECGRWPIG